MIHTYLLQTPDTPIAERWVWPSNAIMADDGTEQTISLAQVPRRSWRGTFSFSREQDIRRHIATMFRKFKGTFYWPAWHQVVKLKAPALAGAVTLFCNTTRAEFAVGSLALIVEGDTSELVTVSTILTDRVTLAGIGLIYAYSARARLAPVILVYSSDNAAVVRRPTNEWASSSFTFLEHSARSPFIADGEKVALTYLNALPILNRRNVGGEFTYTVTTGLEVTDYGGQPHLRSKWTTPKLSTGASYISDRLANPADWRFWRTFFDYCRGGALPFYFPTWRADLDIFTPAAGGGATVVLDGIEYGDHYWPSLSYRAVMFRREDGTTHFANITGRAVVSGRDSLTFAPALPAGDWTTQTISFLLKVRVVDDTVEAVHSGADTLVSVNLRTVE